MTKKQKTIKAIKESFSLGDLVVHLPCEVPLCQEKRTIKTGAGYVCEKHALDLVEKTM